MSWIAALLLIAVLAPTAPAADAAKTRPNVVFILPTISKGHSAQPPRNHGELAKNGPLLASLRIAAD
jgi:hypothetical protein